ncbi:NAD(P)-binding domain-containing protein [Streptomyces sp. MA5143a]|uniref:NAD(P)-binding domain-containing protein n=1 Tax=Streptomyces sp. MA5143a TaxID=2083010 RepID=UPI000D1A051C|nr:NAD(P)-binding domain-containing protein [Streptomyces sp. MA5143a]SPF02849.1 dihydrolipoamide dehydrogenase [Streptomyces sp. MA5143a]
MYDLLVVGAGPYGLSIASHAAAAGLSLRIVGRPMASWRDHMPRGMFLKSEPWASNLSDPEGRWSLDAYCAEQGMTARHGEPIPVEAFASYGLWFARHAGPPVDERMVTALRLCPGGFEATLEDGERLHARTVALAIGVLPFTEVPSALRSLAPAHVSHSSDHSDLERFRDRDVTVVGGGQAALETAALLAELGARARVLARAPRLNWNDLPPSRERSPWQSARSPLSGLGCGWRNWLYSERPGWFRLLPEAKRAHIAKTALGPAGAWWVRERFEPVVEVRLGQRITSAYEWGSSVRLELTSRNGEPSSLETEHVIAATGFKATCGRLGLLTDDVRHGLRAVRDGSPAVGRDFESSVPGLFFAGLTTASGFGPAMRFVHGATFTAETLVRGVRRRLRSRAAGDRIPAPGAGVRLTGTGAVVQN